MNKNEAIDEIIKMLTQLNYDDIISIKNFVFSKQKSNSVLISKKKQKCEMIQAKNFSLVYDLSDDDTKKKIVDVCKSKHEQSEINITNTSDKLVVTINGLNKSRFSKNTKNYDVEGIHPFITTEKIEKSIIPSEVNIEFNDDFVDKVNVVNFNFKNFIEATFYSDSLVKMFELYILNILRSVKILIPSEYMLSALLFYLIVGASKQIKHKRFLIVGLDSKIEESFRNTNFHYRVDTCFLCDNNLFIFEYKFRSDRLNAVRSAEETINDRCYGIRLLNYLQNNNIQDVNKIINVGIAYASGNDISCSVTINSIIINDFYIKNEKLRLAQFYNSKILEKSSIVKYRFIKEKDIKLLPETFCHREIINKYKIFVVLLAKKLDGFVLIKNSTFYYFKLNNVIYMEHCLNTLKPNYVCIHYNYDEMVEDSNIMNELKKSYTLTQFEGLKQFNDPLLPPVTGIFKLNTI